MFILSSLDSTTSTYHIQTIFSDYKMLILIYIFRPSKFQCFHKLLLPLVYKNVDRRKSETTSRFVCWFNNEQFMKPGWVSFEKIFYRYRKLFKRHQKNFFF